MVDIPDFEVRFSSEEESEDEYDNSEEAEYDSSGDDYSDPDDNYSDSDSYVEILVGRFIVPFFVVIIVMFS